VKSSWFVFFDEAERLERIRKIHDPLFELAQFIDFEIFRALGKRLPHLEGFVCFLQLKHALATRAHYIASAL
jgi:hypothetical protein